MIEIAGYANLLANAHLVNNLFVNPPSNNNYNSYNELLPKSLTYEYEDPYAEDYRVELSPEVRELALVYGNLGSSTNFDYKPYEISENLPDMLNSKFIERYGDEFDIEISDEAQQLSLTYGLTN